MRIGRFGGPPLLYGGWLGGNVVQNLIFSTDLKATFKYEGGKFIYEETKI